MAQLSGRLAYTAMQYGFELCVPAQEAEGKAPTGSDAAAPAAITN
jgi:hypothetical protein